MLVFISIVNWKGCEYLCVVEGISIVYIFDTFIPLPFVYYESIMEEKFIVMILLFHGLRYECIDEKS